MIAGRRLDPLELAETLAGSWPIVVAGFILAIPSLLVGLGVWNLSIGLRISNLLGVVILALVGFLAGVISEETWLRRLLLALMSAGLGLVVVAVEFVVHH